MHDLSAVPSLRVDVVPDRPAREDRDYVLYWLIGQRRTRFHFGLEHALLRARELDRPLLVLEPLRVGYRWASDRIQSFLLEEGRIQSYLRMVWGRKLKLRQYLARFSRASRQ